MNRREFLRGLLSVPFGWKALFRKKEEADKLEGIGGFTWGAETGYVYLDAPGEYMHLPGINDTHEFTSGYVDDKWEFPLCEVKPEIRYGQCEEMIESDGIRVDGVDTVNGQTFDEYLADPNRPRFIYANPPLGIDWAPGQWTWAEDICRILAEIVERDAPGMLIGGAADIDWDPPHVYIRYSSGPWFMCSNIRADKTVWYKRVEKPSPYSDLFCTYEWEPV